MMQRYQWEGHFTSEEKLALMDLTNPYSITNHESFEKTVESIRKTKWLLISSSEEISHQHTKVFSQVNIKEVAKHLPAGVYTAMFKILEEFANLSQDPIEQTKKDVWKVDNLLHLVAKFETKQQNIRKFCVFYKKKRNGHCHRFVFL